MQTRIQHTLTQTFESEVLLAGVADDGPGQEPVVFLPCHTWGLNRQEFYYKMLFSEAVAVFAVAAAAASMHIFLLGFLPPASAAGLGRISARNAECNVCVYTRSVECSKLSILTLFAHHRRRSRANVIIIIWMTKESLSVRLRDV